MKISQGRKPRTLYVKKVTIRDLSDHGWPSIYSGFDKLFMGCNVKGIIPWKSGLLYTVEELIARNNVVIIK